MGARALTWMRRKPTRPVCLEPDDEAAHVSLPLPYGVRLGLRGASWTCSYSTRSGHKHLTASHVKRRWRSGRCAAGQLVASPLHIWLFRGTTRVGRGSCPLSSEGPILQSRGRPAVPQSIRLRPSSLYPGGPVSPIPWDGTELPGADRRLVCALAPARRPHVHRSERRAHSYSPSAGVAVAASATMNA
jgi:hypothetical protein